MKPFHACNNQCGTAMQTRADAEYVNDWPELIDGLRVAMFNCPKCHSSFSKAKNPEDDAAYAELMARIQL